MPCIKDASPVSLYPHPVGVRNENSPTFALHHALQSELCEQLIELPLTSIVAFAKDARKCNKLSSQLLLLYKTALCVHRRCKITQLLFYPRRRYAR